MGLIVVKDFNIGYNIRSYLRISRLNYNFKNKQWDINLDFYFDEKSVERKKINEYLKKWVIENSEKVNDEIWTYINNNYLSTDLNLLPIGAEEIHMDAIFTPMDFDNPDEIFKELYGQIKVNPALVKVKEIIRDANENEDIINTVIKDIENLINKS